jgi:hypothetical protein
MQSISRVRTRTGIVVAVTSFIALACSTSSQSASSADSPSVAAGANGAPVAGTHAASTVLTAADSSLLTVYKSPTCGCCKNWVDHMREHGFRASVTDVADVAPVKKTHGVTDDLASCHTALIGGYVVEGHVPAEDVRRLLRERPDIIGIAAPGMPVGSPGMETGPAEKYDVIAFGKDGSRKVFASH